MDYTKILDPKATDSTVWVTAEFAHLHHWPEAPPTVDYLRHPHRHLFKVKLFVRVGHDNRDVEFLHLQGNLQQYIDDNLRHQRSTMSCEQMAEMVARAMMRRGYHVTACEVSEDGENGAIKFFFYEE